LKLLAERLGISSEKIIIERNSHNTHESAMAEILDEIKDGKWLLVTSAFHMPRAFGAFEKAGINTIPYPVDYKTNSNPKDFPIQLPGANIGSYNIV